MRHWYKTNLWDKSYWAKQGGVRAARNIPHGFHWRHLRFWNSPIWKEIKDYLVERNSQGHDIFPSPKGQVSYKHIFRSLEETPFKQVKIVILGQDPYWQKGLADGLAFSVRPNVSSIPGTLRNILKEYTDDLRFKRPITGDLSTWARNGVLLWNVIPTIEEQKLSTKKPPHERINGRYLWQELTVEILEELSKRKDKLVFILWGKRAQDMRYMIDEKKHLVLIGGHPSPRNCTTTAKNGIMFRGGSYFTQACKYLDISPIIWKLP